MTDYFMAFNMGTENPVGLLQITDEDTSARGLGQWFPLSTDNTVFEDVDLINVSEEFLEFFDMIENKDRLPTYKQTQKYAN